MAFSLENDVRLPIHLFTGKKTSREYTPGFNIDSSSPADISMVDWINQQILDGNIDVTGAAGDAVTVDGTQTITGDKTFSAEVVVNGGISGGASADITLNTTAFTVDATQGNTVVGGTLTVNGATVDMADATTFNLAGLPTYADDAAAGTGGLVAGDVYVVTATNALAVKAA